MASPIELVGHFFQTDRDTDVDINRIEERKKKNNIKREPPLLKHTDKACRQFTDNHFTFQTGFGEESLEILWKWCSFSNEFYFWLRVFYIYIYIRHVFGSRLLLVLVLSPLLPLSGRMHICGSRRAMKKVHSTGHIIPCTCQYCIPHEWNAIKI